MHDLILITALFALLYGFTWHDQPARRGEPEDYFRHRPNQKGLNKA